MSDKKLAPVCIWIDVVKPQPRSLSDDVALLIIALKGRGWVTRKALMPSVIVRPNITAKEFKHWTERRFRLVAEASDGVIVGGPKGYALRAEVPTADLIHVANRRRAQAEKDRAASDALFAWLYQHRLDEMEPRHA